AEAIAQFRADPNMVEPPPLVDGRPIGRAVAPPRVELGRFGNEPAHDVDPVSGSLGVAELLALDRRMGDHVEKVLVAPHVMFERCDVEVADENRALLDM